MECSKCKKMLTFAETDNDIKGKHYCQQCFVRVISRESANQINKARREAGFQLHFPKKILGYD